MELNVKVLLIVLISAFVAHGVPIQKRSLEDNALKIEAKLDSMINEMDELKDELHSIEKKKLAQKKDDVVKLTPENNDHFGVGVPLYKENVDKKDEKHVPKNAASDQMERKKKIIKSLDDTLSLLGKLEGKLDAKIKMDELKKQKDEANKNIEDFAEEEEIKSKKAVGPKGPPVAYNDAAPKEAAYKDAGAPAMSFEDAGPPAYKDAGAPAMSFKDAGPPATAFKDAGPPAPHKDVPETHPKAEDEHTFYLEQNEKDTKNDAKKSIMEKIEKTMNDLTKVEVALEQKQRELKDQNEVMDEVSDSKKVSEYEDKMDALDKEINRINDAKEKVEHLADQLDMKKVEDEKRETVERLGKTLDALDDIEKKLRDKEERIDDEEDITMDGKVIEDYEENLKQLDSEIDKVIELKIKIENLEASAQKDVTERDIKHIKKAAEEYDEHIGAIKDTLAENEKREAEAKKKIQDDAKAKVEEDAANAKREEEKKELLGRIRDSMEDLADVEDKLRQREKDVSEKYENDVQEDEELSEMYEGKLDSLGAQLDTVSDVQGRMESLANHVEDATSGVSALEDSFNKFSKHIIALKDALKLAEEKEKAAEEEAKEDAKKKKEASSITKDLEKLDEIEESFQKDTKVDNKKKDDVETKKEVVKSLSEDLRILNDITEELKEKFGKDKRDDTAVNPTFRCNNGVTIKKMGCYYWLGGSDRTLNTMRLNLRSSINWDNMEKFLKELICQCAKAAKDEGETVIGTQFWGECWTDSQKRTMTDLQTSGALEEVTDCSNPRYYECRRCDEKENLCVGKDFSTVVYNIES